MSFIQIFTLSSVAFLAITPSLAQDSPQCADISPQLAYNASTTRNITALNLLFLGDSADRDVVIQEDPSRTWQVSAYLQPAGSEQSPNLTQTTLWLDTGSTNTDRLGQLMGMCHNVVPLTLGGNLTWSKDILERSLEDTGDCKTMVSEECIAALQTHYNNEASTLRGSDGGCRSINNTVPIECEGMAEPISINVPRLNSTLPAHFPWHTSASPNTTLTDPLTCSGRNLSRSYGAFTTMQDFDVGVNFPLLNIMTFWPRVEPGNTFSPRAQNVQIMCLRPDQDVQWSRRRDGVEELLDRMESKNGDQRSGGARGIGGVGAEKLMGLVVGMSGVIAFAL